LIMLALALTSNDASLRRLGHGWKILHRAVYVAALLSFAHWVLSAFNPTPGYIHLGVLAALELLDSEPPYARLEELAGRLCDGLADALRQVPHTVNRVGSLFSVFFGDSPVTDAASAKAADHAAYAAFFHAMLARGVYLPPSGYEGWFPSAAHGDAEVDRTVEAARAAAGELERATSRS
ncbi:MAG: hypothetical protein WD770_06685, partial [Actinomycetota bacterium]